MSKSLNTISFLDLLPSSISGDPQMQAAAQALDGVLQETTAAIEQVAILSRIDELPETLLDELAWQFHVDFWPEGLSLASKRATIKSALLIHKHKGTVWAVREAFRVAGYIDAAIEEGTGGHWARFDVIIDVNQNLSVEQESLERALDLLDKVKPERSHLNEVRFTYSSQGDVPVYAFAMITGAVIEVSPQP